MTTTLPLAERAPTTLPPTTAASPSRWREAAPSAAHS